MVLSAGPTLNVLLVSTIVIKIYSIQPWKSVLSPKGKTPEAEDWRKTAKLLHLHELISDFYPHPSNIGWVFFKKPLSRNLSVNPSHWQGIAQESQLHFEGLPALPSIPTSTPLLHNSDVGIAALPLSIPQRTSGHERIPFWAVCLSLADTL